MHSKARVYEPLHIDLEGLIAQFS